MSEQFLGRFDVDFKGVKPGRESMTEDVVTHPTDATMTVRIAEGGQLDANENKLLRPGLMRKQ